MNENTKYKSNTNEKDCSALLYKLRIKWMLVMGFTVEEINEVNKECPPTSIKEELEQLTSALRLNGK